jgi:Flp pilus assembly protein TadG
VRPRPDRDDRGSALVELVWLGIILLVPLIWIVVSVFEVQRGAYAVSAAARAAGRAYALADDDGSGRAAAQAVMARTLADQGVEGMTGSLAVTCSPYPGSCHEGTSVVTIRVDSRVALPLMPEILGGGSPSFALDASHTVPIGTYVERRDP